MKRNVWSHFRALAALAVMGAIALTVYAQPGGGGGPGGGGFAGGGRGGGGFGLDEQQGQLLREALQKDNETLAKLEEQLRQAQKELIKVVLAEQYDEKVVREKADAVAKIQTEMLMLRCKAFSSVAPTLKPEQRAQLEESRFGMMMLAGGFGGRGGMMMGGGPGGPNDPNAVGGRGGRGGFGGPGGPGGDPNAGGFGGRGGRGGFGGAPGAPGGPGADPNAGGGRGGRGNRGQGGQQGGQIPGGR